MFSNFFFLLRAHGVPVSVTEWLNLTEALSLGMARSSLLDFYSLARSILVKSEAYFDQYDQAFGEAFGGIETPAEIAEEVWEWLADPLDLAGLDADEQARMAEALGPESLEELHRRFEELLKEQTEAHHGGQHWIGTGGTSPFGHSGVHPGGMRVGGSSGNRSAVKVAGERRYRGYRTDVTVGVRQFEVALRRLRRLTAKEDMPPDKLDVEGTVDATADQAGMLSLVWTHERRNQVKIVLLMDAGGSMHAHNRLCSRLFTAVNRAEHFKDLRSYYFHNCVYDHLYQDPTCHPRNSVPTAQVLHELTPDYKLVLVGDASMAPSELLARHGIIWWGSLNEEPGIEWLQRLKDHFSHSVWLNPIPEYQWETIYGRETIGLIRNIFPMYELTVDGLTAAVGKLLVKR